MLLSLKFTRDHEKSADDLAWELFQRSQVNPQGLVDFFSGLKSEMDSGGIHNHNSKRKNKILTNFISL